jgi:formylglycine-generating enzyme required for sulfatase activity/dipeptide/tripeptide permease
MSDVFISYRKGGTDRQAAQTLRDRLAKEFDVYLDARSIALPGELWSSLIAREIARSRVVLVVIGRDWVDSIPRLSDPNDPIRAELQLALAPSPIGKERRVVPVLVSPAAFPDAASLPPDLRKLATFNAFKFDAGGVNTYIGDLREILSRALKESVILPASQTIAPPRAQASGPSESVRAPASAPADASSIADRAVTDRPFERHPNALWFLAGFIACCQLASSFIVSGLTPYGGLSAGLTGIDTLLGVHFALRSMLLLPGGWLGDRVWGARRTVWIGTITALGGAAALTAVHWLFVMPNMWWQWSAFTLVAIGFGLLEGNALVVLGRAYPSAGGRRIVGFVIFHWASTLGAAVSSLVLVPLQARILTGTLIMALGAVLWRRGDAAFSAVYAAGTLSQQERTAQRGRTPVSAFLAGAVILLGVFVGTLLDVPVYLVMVGAGSLVLAFFLSGAVRQEPGRVAWRPILMLLFFVALFTGLEAMDWSRATLGNSRVNDYDEIVHSVLALVSGLVVVRYWGSRAARESAALLAWVFATAFLLEAIAFILPSFAAPGPIVVTLIQVLRGFADATVTPISLSALTTAVPIGLTGTLVGARHLAGFVGSEAFQSVPVDAATAVLAGGVTAVAAGVVAAVRRHTLFDFDAPARLTSPVRESPRLTTGWVLAGAGGILVAGFAVASFNARRTATPPARTATAAFATRGAVDLFLPDDGDLGFVPFSEGSATIGVAPQLIGDQRRPESGAQPPLAAPDESPARTLDLPEFLIGKYEVTVAEYNACVRAGACQPSDARARNGLPNRPVRYITWREALDYCNWLGANLAALARTGRSSLLMRVLAGGAVASLPSEGEWERAAHGIDVQAYPWSGPLTPLKANYAATGRLAPSGVGEFEASANGLADMAGNVAEWTRSEYQPYPYNPEDGRESLTADPAARVIRGGSFYDGPSLLRTTSRQAADPHRGYDYVGFRVVLTTGVRPVAPAQQSAAVQQRPAAAASSKPTSAKPPPPKASLRRVRPSAVGT